MKNRTWIFMMGTAAVLGLWPSVGRAAPRWLRLSWTQDPSTSITVSWTDGPGSGAAQLQLPDNTVLDLDAVTVDTGSSDLDTTYSVTFTGLQPDSEYQYRVQSSGQWSQWESAKTAPAPGSCTHFTFVMGGDSRGEDVFGTYRQVQWPVIIGFIAAEQPLFMLHSGDYVRSGDEPDQWATELDDLTVLSTNHQFFMTLGNHDTGPTNGQRSYFDMLFAYPADNPDGVEDYYSFVAGNLQVVCLSSETFDIDTQIDWLDQTLTAHESEVDWKVVFFHRPIWSSGAHGSNDGDRMHPEALLPVLEAHGVDIVLNGHDHDYERFHPSRGGYGTPREVNPLPQDNGTRGEADGVIYIVSGGAGALVNPAFSPSEEGSAFASNHLHYLVAQVMGGTMVLTVRDLGSQSLSDPTMEGDMEVITLEKSNGICSGGSDPDAGVGDGGMSQDAQAGQDGTLQTDANGATDSSSAQDGGVGADAGPVLDGGQGGSGTADSGCSCQSSKGASIPFWPLLFVALFLVGVGRKSRRS